MGLHQVLGGASCMYLLLRREDVAGKDPVFFFVLISALYLSFILYLLYLYSRMGKRASMTGLDPMDL